MVKDCHWQKHAPNPAGGFRGLSVLVPGRGHPSGESETNLPDDIAPPKDWKLKIIHVNDLHHHHLRVALPALLAQERRCDAEVIYLSAGDEFTGTALDDLLGYDPPGFLAAPAYRLQSELGLDVAALGNHDFDRGPAVLERSIISDAAFPVLSANVIGSEHLRSYFPAARGVTPAGVRVGIIACITPEELQVPQRLDASIRITDPVAAVMDAYDQVAAASDLVIILSHLGFNTPGSRHSARQDDAVLAEALAARRDDAPGGRVPCCIIGGHTHTVLDHRRQPVLVSGIPIYQAGCNGQWLGVVEATSEGTTGTLLQVPSLGDEASVASWTTAEEIRREVDQRVAGTIGEYLVGDRISTPAVLVDRLCGECALANGISDLLWRGMPELFSLPDHDMHVVACDASGIHGGFGSAGDDRSVTIRDWYRILPYADTLYSGIVTPKQLLAIISSNARRIMERHTVTDPMDWSVIARGFLHFSGELRYRIGSHRELLDEPILDGQPLSELPEETAILLTVNSFTGTGNQGWGRENDASFREFGSVSLVDLPLADTGHPLRLALIELIRRSGRFQPTLDGRVTCAESP